LGGLLLINSLLKKIVESAGPLLLFIPVFFAAGCASSSMSVDIKSPYMYSGELKEEIKRHSEEVLGEIDDRNRVVEDNSEWIKESYKGFMIKNMADINEKDYVNYARYLDNNSVYVIVHPAYYTFFNDNYVPSDTYGGKSDKNAVDMLLSETTYTNKAAVIRAQEKMLRDFIEYMSTEKKLVVLLLPRGYRTYPGYKYRDSSDEFMRYINEVSNESESVVYLYTKKPSRGSLSEKDRKMLLKFLYGVRANSILLGGGYIGRCLEDFYKEVEPFVGEDKLYIVPEITAFSLSDMTSDIASSILMPDGTINVGKLSVSIKTNALGNQDILPQVRNLSLVNQTP
jgi:hypothetical protein